MSTSGLITCYNCGCLLPQNGKPCFGCGAVNKLPTVNKVGGTVQRTEYVYEASHENGDGSNDGNVEDFSFPEVEISPPTLEGLLELYASTVEQLRVEGCLFYTIMYNPRNGLNDIKHAGVPEATADSVTDTLKIHFPIRRQRKARPKPSDQDELKRYPCPEPNCDYRTKYPWQVKNHMRFHTGEKPFACTRCNYRTADNSQLVKHTRAHNLITPFRCAICDLGFVKQRGVDRHMSLTHGLADGESVRDATGAIIRQSKSYHCDICGKVNKSKKSHNEHRYIHTGERPYACTMCAYRARQVSSLNVHLKSHVGMEEKALGCEKCSFRADQYSVLTHHIKLFHLGDVMPSVEDAGDARILQRIKSRRARKTGPWICSQCDQELETRVQLFKHRREVHGLRGTKSPYKIVNEGGDHQRYQCGWCKFISTDKAAVLSHTKMHTVRRHACDLCNFKTSAINTLNRHKGAIHGILRPNKCDKCSFASELYNKLVMHKRTVHGMEHNLELRTTKSNQGRSKPEKLKCDKCSFATICSRIMTAHQNVHDGVRYTCIVCGYTDYDELGYQAHMKMHPNRKRRAVANPTKSTHATSLLGHFIIPSPLPASKSTTISGQTADKRSTTSVEESVTKILETLNKEPSSAVIDEPKVTSVATKNNASSKIANLLKLKRVYRKVSKHTPVTTSVSTESPTSSSTSTDQSITSLSLDTSNASGSIAVSLDTTSPMTDLPTSASTVTPLPSYNTLCLEPETESPAKANRIVGLCPTVPIPVAGKTNMARSIVCKKSSDGSSETVTSKSQCQIMKSLITRKQVVLYQPKTSGASVTGDKFKVFTSADGTQTIIPLKESPQLSQRLIMVPASALTKVSKTSDSNETPSLLTAGQASSTSNAGSTSKFAHTIINPTVVKVLNNVTEGHLPEVNWVDDSHSTPSVDRTASTFVPCEEPTVSVVGETLKTLAANQTPDTIDQTPGSSSQTASAPTNDQTPKTAAVQKIVVLSADDLPWREYDGTPSGSTIVVSKKDSGTPEL